VFGFPSDEALYAIVSSSASANYGSLRATVNAIIQGGGAMFWLAAEAKFIDTLTVSGLNGSGYISYLIKGSYDFASDGLGASISISQAGHSLAGFDYGEAIGKGDFVFSTSPTPFMFGQAFPFSMVVDAGTYGSDDNSGSGDINAGIFGITVYDSAAQPVTDYTISSASGRFSPVPEPAAWFLLTNVLVVLAALRRGLPIRI
jgi:hypothetical protein